MIDWIVNFQFNGMLGLYLYWAPLLVCAICYIVRSWEDVQKDIKSREAWNLEPRYYSPTIKLSTVVGRILATVIPVLNLLMMIFDVGPILIGRVMRVLGDTLDIPLVPARKNK
jgi:hypothetical protein